MQWPKRPQVIRHPLLGRLHRWRSRCGLVRIDRYLDQSRQFLAQQQLPHGWQLISRHRKLSAAQRTLEQMIARQDREEDSTAEKRKKIQPLMFTNSR